MNVTRLDTTTFLVTSENLLRCASTASPPCRYTVDLSKGRLLKPGDRCPKCRAAKLEVVTYHIDRAANDGLGACDCPHWQCRIGPFLRRLSKLELAEVEIDCKHIRAVTRFDYRQMLRNHIKEQNGVHA